MSADRPRSVLVTGAARGLGLATARRVGESGDRVWVADIRRELGEEAVRGLVAEGIDARFVEVDITDEASVEAMAKTVSADGPVYALVNNAARADGVGGKAVHEISVAEWDSVLDVNLRGTWLVSRAVAPGMIAAGVGRIVNLGSDAALFGSPRLAHYIASKGGVAALTRAMASDLGPHGITVNTVAPGLTETEATEAVPAERHQLYRSLRALERTQQPDDVCGVVAFLLSPDAGYITGQQIVVNGGFVYH
jgi:NAD(P)-dependent dehydrogenase (short-subunit alcohol dehydrogenase family)